MIVTWHEVPGKAAIIESVRTSELIRPYPTGRLFLGALSRHFVPGYDRTVPPGQKAIGRSH
jgi:hypothetical protein